MAVQHEHECSHASVDQVGDLGCGDPGVGCAPWGLEDTLQNYKHPYQHVS